MTVAMAWVATRPNGREDLFFASDSRTRGGCVFDLCPKILTLPRSDCAICFAGDLDWSFPLMLQISNAIAAHQPSRERNLDIGKLKSHLLRLSSDIVASVDDISVPFGHSTAQFIFGGYSWQSQAFRVWTFSYRPEQREFCARESHGFAPRLAKVAFIGDWARRLRSALAKELLKEREGKLVQYEPLFVLSRMLKGTSLGDSIGGAPQVVRIGPHMNTRPLCVLWGPDRRRMLLGRPLLDYENCDYWSIDPESGEIAPPPPFGRTSDV